MADEKQQRPQTVVQTVSRILSSGEIVELVYDAKARRTKLAVGIDDEFSLQEAVAIEANTKLIPLSADNDLIKHEVLLLPALPEAFESVPHLVGEIEAYFHRYVDLSERFRRIAAYYVLLTWVYDAFNELPYLRFRGDFGSGKSRALIVIGSLCYKAFFASGASTVSPLFHLLDALRGTLIVDEADFRFSDENAQLVKILNNGNTRGFPVLRTMPNAKREWVPRAFNVFSPKMIAMRHSFDDPALESRFITEEMGQTELRYDIPINLPDDQKDEALVLRNKLLAYRFLYRKTVSVDPFLADPDLSPRGNQILLPLLSIIEDEATREEIAGLARGLEHTERVTRSATIEAHVLEVLRSLLGDPARERVTIGDVTAVLADRYGKEYERPLTSRYVGAIVRKRLHLPTYKSGGVYVVPKALAEQVRILCKKYGLDEAE